MAGCLEPALKDNSMRWNEFVTESDESAGSVGGKGGKKSSLNKNHSSVIPNATRYPDKAAHYYDMYRFGIHMAGSPENQHMEKEGPVANEMVTIAYSQAYLDIIEKSARAMGFKGSKMTSKGSIEPKDTYTTSPVAKWK
jgi:hypothetical protein